MVPLKEMHVEFENSRIRRLEEQQFKTEGGVREESSICFQD